MKRYNSKRDTQVITYPKDGEYADRTIKRFLKKCKKQRVIDNFLDATEFYEKPSDVRKEAARRRKKVLKKLHDKYIKKHLSE